MNVLITRPERDATELKARIEALGCKVLHAPLLEIELLPIDAAAIAEATGLIATSRNALRALAASKAFEPARHMDLFAVGPATAAVARDLGFDRILEGPGTAAGLAEAIANRLRSDDGRLAHLAGDHLAFDMAGALAARGWRVSNVPAYRSVAAKTLPAEVAHALEAGTIDAVVLLSPRTAETWTGLLAERTQKIDLTRIKHVCLSPKVAEALPPPVSKFALVAQTPEIEEIITILYRLAGDTKNR